jgi:hypothetical protein
MKRTFIRFIFVLGLMLTASFPAGGRPADALDLIEKAGKLTLQADAEVKPLLEQRITIELKDASVEEALAFVLKAAKLTYKVLDDHTVQILKPQQ